MKVSSSVAPVILVVACLSESTTTCVDAFNLALGKNAFIGKYPLQRGPSVGNVFNSCLSMSLTPQRIQKSGEGNTDSTSTSLHAVTLDSMTMDAGQLPAAEQLESPQKKSYVDDGFVFGLEGSGLERPKGKVASLVVEDDSLETKPYQMAMTYGTLASHFLVATHAVSEVFATNPGDVAGNGMHVFATLLISWILADLGSGIFHWSVDNYGNGKTPVLGSIIAAFQGHHSAPWTITEREFANNVHKLCIPFGIPTMLAINAVAGPQGSLFFASFFALEIMSQELHKWSHMTKSQVPRGVNALQDAGLILGRKSHAQHHMAPYDGNYCIVSGACNDVLDRSGFFRWMEHMVYNMNGVESNAWKLDEGLRERTLSGKYTLK